MFKGLTRGFQLIADFFRFLIHAIESGNVAKITAAVAVAKLWMVEATEEVKGVPGIIKGNLITALLFGSDPFKGSRAALQALFAQYGKP